MLLGSVGRTDLAGPWVTDRLSHLQHQSARRLSEELPDAAAILPTHGFGSLCSAGFPAGGADSADARISGREPGAPHGRGCVRRPAGVGAGCLPALLRVHRPRGIAKAPRRPTSTCRRSAKPESSPSARAPGNGSSICVTARVRRPPSCRHARVRAFGSAQRRISGWLLPWGSPLSLIGRSREDLAAARRALVRIGSPDRRLRNHPRWRTGTTRGPASRPSCIPSSASASSSRSSARPVRSSSTCVSPRVAEGHLAGALHIPLHELPDRIDEIPPEGSGCTAPRDMGVGRRIAARTCGAIADGGQRPVRQCRPGGPRHRLCLRLSIAAGFGAMSLATRAAAAARPPSPGPDTRCRGATRIAVAMPDGVALLTDRYWPRGGGREPVIVMRSPYGRDTVWALAARLFAERGYQVILQSCRGTGGSQGDFDAYRHERQDGLATLAWIAAQPWFAGKMAMAGPSYPESSSGRSRRTRRRRSARWPRRSLQPVCGVHVPRRHVLAGQHARLARPARRAAPRRRAPAAW